MAQTLPKKPQILGGIMQALYGMSGVEADPTFEDAASRAEGEAMFGAENLTPKNTTRPYKGSGLFGGVKAKGANNAYAGQDALAEAAGQRSLRLLPEQLRIQGESAAGFQTARDAEILKAKIAADQLAGDTAGNAINEAMGGLLSDQFNAISPDPNTATYGSTGKPLADYYKARFGDATVDNAPALAAAESNKFKVESDPRAFDADMGARMNKGFSPYGDTSVNPATDDTIRHGGTVMSQTQIPIFGTKYDETGNMVEDRSIITGYKTTSTPIDQPARRQKLASGMITQDDLNATKNPNVGGGGTSPVSKPGYQEAVENPFVTPTTNPNPPTPAPAEVATPKAKPLLDNYEGIVPDLVNSNFGLNPIDEWLKNNISQPIYEGGKALMESPPQPQIGTGFKQFTDNSGKLLGDIGKTIIRPKGSQFSGTDPIELIRQALQGAGDSASGMINKVAVPASETLEGVSAPIRDTLNKVADNMHENDANYRKVTSERNAIHAAKRKALEESNAKSKVSAKPAPADPNQELFDMFKKYGHGANVRSSATAPEDLQKLAASMTKQLELGPAFNTDGMLEKDLARVLEMLQQFKPKTDVKIR